MQFRRFLSGVITLVILLAPFTLLWQRQNITDWWTLRSYTPPQQIAQLATDTTMNDLGKKIFYVEHPALQAKADFQQSCTLTEKTIVLGCYKSASGIFVYDVNDPRLDGVQQVTAAHEMLHAAYDRLSSTEKKRIDTLTEQAYAQLKDQRIKDNVEAYRSQDATVVPNELHSILGTEVAKLPAELEAHYALYFTNRQKIVTYSVQYETEFSKRSQQVATYDKLLESLRSQYDKLKTSIDSQEQAIRTIDAQLDAYKAQNDFENYNAAIPGRNRLVSKYKADIVAVNSLADQYKNILDKRNAIAVEEQQLLQALDSRVSNTR